MHSYTHTNRQIQSHTHNTYFFIHTYTYHITRIHTYKYARAFSRLIRTTTQCVSVSLYTRYLSWNNIQLKCNIHSVLENRSFVLNKFFLFCPSLYLSLFLYTFGNNIKCFGEFNVAFSPHPLCWTNLKFLSACVALLYNWRWNFLKCEFFHNNPCHLIHTYTRTNKHTNTHTCIHMFLYGGGRERSSLRPHQKQVNEDSLETCKCHVQSTLQPHLEH